MNIYHADIVGAYQLHHRLHPCRRLLVDIESRGVFPDSPKKRQRSGLFAYETLLLDYCWVNEGTVVDEIIKHFAMSRLQMVEANVEMMPPRHAKSHDDELRVKHLIMDAMWGRRPPQPCRGGRRSRLLHNVPSGPNPISNDLPSGYSKTLRSPPAAHRHRHF